MRRKGRILAAIPVVLLALFALHVQLNLGGWPRFLWRLRSGTQVRGELVVGYLPVT